MTAEGGTAVRAPSDPADEADRPALAFVGVGWIGGLRLDAVEEAGVARVAALCDANADRLGELEGRFPEARCHTDVAELLDSAARELDGVVLATPNALHAPHARAAVERELPVFVQKPLGLDPREVASVLDAARARDVLIAVDYSYRHLAGARRLRKLVRSGALGEIELVEAEFHNAYGPDKAWCFQPDLSGGGALLDLGVHLVDLALWILDPASLEGVRSWTRALSDRPGIDRMAGAEMRLDGDVPFRLTSSWHANTGCDCVFRFTLHGSEGGGELRNRDGGFYDFELAVRHGRTEEIAERDSRSWMDRGILRWVERIADGGAFNAAAESSLRVSDVVARIYREARG